MIAPIPDSNKSPEQSAAFEDALAPNQLPCVFVHGLKATKYKKNLVTSVSNQNRREIKYFDAMISFLPNQPQLYIDRGVLLMQEGELQSAISDFSTAIQVSENSSIKAVAHSNRGTILNIIDQHIEAIEEFNTAIELNDQLWSAFFGRAGAFMHLESYQKATDDFTRCIQLNSQHPECFIERAKAYYQMARYDLSMQDCNIAIMQEPQMLEGYLIRSQAQLAQGNGFQAIEDLTAAIEIDSNFAPAFLLRSKILRALGSDQWLMDRKKAHELDNNLDFSP